MDMANILVILAHPNYSQSQINRELVDSITHLPNVSINDIYACYPDGIINIEAEQKKLEHADIVVFQHPFYWYSAPALMKEWIDLVLQFNYAYGPKGTALQNKKWLSVITTGSPENAYQQEGLHKFSIRQFLTPFEQTADLCKMTFLPPIIAYCSRTLTSDENKLNEVKSLYQNTLKILSDAKTELGDVLSLETMNQVEKV